MKRTTVTTLVANLRRAIARCLDRISARATRTDSRSRGTSRIGDLATTGALCPDVTEMTVRKQRLTPTLRSLFLSLRGVKRRGNPVGKATTGRNPLDCRVGPLGLLAMTRMVKASCSSSRLLGSIGSAFLIAGIATMSTSLSAAEQDNWYLADEWSVSNAQGITYELNATTGKARIYATATNANKLQIFEANGTLVREISGLFNPRDVAVDGNGTIYIIEMTRVTAFNQDGNMLWRHGKNANSGSGSYGSGDREFNQAHGIAVSPSGELFVADYNNHRVQVLDRNGTFKRKFGYNGSAPGQLYRPIDLAFLPDGTLIVGDQNYLHYFKQDGTFLKRTNISSARQYVSAAPDGTIFSYQNFRDSDGRYNKIHHRELIQTPVLAFTPEGDLFESRAVGGNRLGIQDPRIWKRAYRTKGLATVRNVIPQPAIRGIGQRAGTNIIDLDFEIIDPDDANATVGILAAVDGAFDRCFQMDSVPQAWVDGTGSKIGASPSPPTRSTGYPGTSSPTGRTAIRVLSSSRCICRDARRDDSPVDLHFLELPLADGNLTISRSPLTDSDFETHFKYLPRDWEHQELRYE